MVEPKEPDQGGALNLNSMSAGTPVMDGWLRILSEANITGHADAVKFLQEQHQMEPDEADRVAQYAMNPGATGAGRAGSY